MTHCEEEFARICETVVEVTFESVGTRLTDEEIAELATELATTIMLTFQASAEPVPEMAGDVMEEFFRKRGIVDVEDNWHWMN